MRLLITGGWNCTAEQVAALEERGHTVLRMADERGPLPCAYDWVEGVVCNGLFLHHPMERFTALRYVQLTSAGYDRVPLDEICARGITLYNAGDTYSGPMAEFAVAAVLHFYKQWAFFRHSQQARHWKKNLELKELDGKTVCIVGCGNVGTACARRFRAFGCRVVGVNRTVRERDDFDCIYPLAELKQQLSRADIVILALPLTEQTRGLVDADGIAALKEGCVLVNIARGALVDERALAGALARRELYAALDVFEAEPLAADSPLWAMENVVITPHNSFVGEGNEVRLSGLILRNMENWGN